MNQDNSFYADRPDVVTTSLNVELFNYGRTLFWDAKIKDYQDADLFVLPTLSENFGMVVPEALACGAPVITTKGAPWQELETTGSGWWIDIGTDPLKACLAEALSCSSEELSKMGYKGRTLVKDQYGIESVAKKMMQVYQWCLGGEKPVFLYEGE